MQIFYWDLRFIFKKIIYIDITCILSANLYSEERMLPPILSIMGILNPLLISEV
jgi:hypothetical protein